MPKLSKTEQLFRTLPADVQYDIEMQLYIEFNDDLAKLSDAYYFGDEVISKKDLIEMKRLETARKRELTERWLKENERIHNN